MLSEENVLEIEKRAESMILGTWTADMSALIQAWRELKAEVERLKIKVDANIDKLSVVFDKSEEQAKYIAAVSDLVQVAKKLADFQEDASNCCGEAMERKLAEVERELEKVRADRLERITASNEGAKIFFKELDAVKAALSACAAKGCAICSVPAASCKHEGASDPDCAACEDVRIAASGETE